MINQSIDTDQKIEKLQLAILKDHTVEKRISLALSLSAATIQLSKRAIERAHPGIDKKNSTFCKV